MLTVLTAEQMRAMDQWAIEEMGIPGVVLMENAGTAIVRRLQEIFPDLPAKKIIIFCGKGNNGGDGFVIARHLSQLGANAAVLLAGTLVELKGDAKTNALSAENLEIPIQELNPENINKFDHKLRHADIFVDALFGTGLSKPVTGFLETVINKINQHEKYTVSVDINSGIDSDSGKLIGPHVLSDITFALASMKQSHLLHPSAGAMKKVEVLDIGIPERDDKNVQIHLLEEEDIKSIFQPRQPDAHKGSYGHVLVLAGSRGKTGAAGLTALAALRSGCGLCTLALPETCQKAFELHPMEVMTVPLPETASGSLSIKAKEPILKLLEGKSIAAMGPGLTTDPETVELIGEILPLIQCPLVLDADALNALEKNIDWLDNVKSAVLTPHPKEMSRLTGMSTQEIQEDRIGVTTRFAQKHSLVLLLKGAPSLIGTPDGNVYINPTGNPGMATGGSGDVLTGIIAGLAAQNISLKNASLAGAYIHGYTGDLFAESESQTNLIAGDLLRNLPDALKRVLP
ncbi:MAG: NAD(P)H-hydrate dehydratase [Nitrospinae bacterium]|nr:NAD(P)H-hydrate dehydratase [Nitrospinota bacterium]MZH15287.1 NAD(P)H-hydrate dehydratase [Nitrospinota bacterium]